MENDLFYELLQEAFSKKIISYPLGKEEAYNQGVLACKSILHDIYKRGFRHKDVVQVVHCKDCKYWRDFGNEFHCCDIFTFIEEYDSVGYDSAPDDYCSRGVMKSEGNI